MRPACNFKSTSGQAAAPRACAPRCAKAGSSQYTLGFSAPTGGAPTVLCFVAAGSGPLLIALLIRYLPTEPIDVSYAEFLAAWQSLDAVGFPGESDPETGYRNFAAGGSTGAAGLPDRLADPGPAAGLDRPPRRQPGAAASGARPQPPPGRHRGKPADQPCEHAGTGPGQPALIPVPAQSW
ncbi:MAG: hypothetical protein ACR2N4_14410 [Jatrophihabitans sp.]